MKTFPKAVALAAFSALATVFTLASFNAAVGQKKEENSRLLMVTGGKAQGISIKPFSKKHMVRVSSEDDRGSMVEFYTDYTDVKNEAPFAVVGHENGVYFRVADPATKEVKQFPVTVLLKLLDKSAPAPGAAPPPAARPLDSKVKTGKGRPDNPACGCAQCDCKNCEARCFPIGNG